MSLYLGKERLTSFLLGTHHCPVVANNCTASNCLSSGFSIEHLSNRSPPSAGTVVTMADDLDFLLDDLANLGASSPITEQKSTHIETKPASSSREPSYQPERPPKSKSIPLHISKQILYSKSQEALNEDDANGTSSSCHEHEDSDHWEDDQDYQPLPVTFQSARLLHTHDEDGAEKSDFTADSGSGASTTEWSTSESSDAEEEDERIKDRKKLEATSLYLNLTRAMHNDDHGSRNSATQRKEAIGESTPSISYEHKENEDEWSDSKEGPDKHDSSEGIPCQADISFQANQPGLESNQPVPSSTSTAPTTENKLNDIEDTFDELDMMVSEIQPVSFKESASTKEHTNTVEDKLQEQESGQCPQQNDSEINTIISPAMEVLEHNHYTVNFEDVQEGVCPGCLQESTGEAFVALEHYWHPDHLVCNACETKLIADDAQGAFCIGKDGFPYCDEDYHRYFSPKCTYCGNIITDTCINALNQFWHKEHFFCAQCGSNFNESGFMENRGKPYCNDCYFSMFADKCRGCTQPIMKDYITAMNSKWHPHCFTCTDCEINLSDAQQFYEYLNKPYCEIHYHTKSGSACARCKLPITGRCITAGEQRYHPEHFTCSYCKQSLSKGQFKQRSSKPYCLECHSKLFE
eukprot:Nk52_evm18s1967 gene=Nk52_evmTU18s1967